MNYKKPLLFIAACIVSAYAFSDAYDLVLMQRNASDTGYNGRVLTSPAAGAIGILVYDQPNLLPAYLTLGSGLSISAGVLNSASLQVNSDWTAISGVTQIMNKPTLTNGTVTSIIAGTGLIGGTITSTGTISLPNMGTAGAYSNVTTDAQGRVTSGTARSISYSARSLNNCFQISSTRDVHANYSIDISTSISLSGGQRGTVYLRTYTNSSCTTGTQEVARIVNGQTGTLTIGLAITQNVTSSLSGMVQAGLWAQLVTENNVGTPTFTALATQEVSL